MPKHASSRLTAQLAAEYGDLLPLSLIDRTVAAARAAAEPPDELAAARTARADVAAMAEAARRRSGVLPGSA